jgi:hypothetical protein
LKAARLMKYVASGDFSFNVTDEFIQGLYDEKESSMDELGGFEPTDTTGFIQIESIRIKKYVDIALSWITLNTLLVIDGHRRTSAEGRVALNQGMYMVLVSECHKENVALI